MGRRRPLRDRFEEKYQVDPRGCWIWTGGITRSGYGAFFVDGQNRPAHRIAYELLVGEIPSGLHVDHLCRVRACVNPAHLEPVTPRENLLRGQTLAALNAQKATCPRGHDYDVVRPRADGTSYRACRACHRETAARARQKAKGA